MTRDHIILEFKTFLIDIIGADETLLTVDRDLLESNILDSYGILSMTVFMEEKFGITIIPEEMTLENYRSLANLTDLVLPKLADKEA